MALTSVRVNCFRRAGMRTLDLYSPARFRVLRRVDTRAPQTTVAVATQVSQRDYRSVVTRSYWRLTVSGCFQSSPLAARTRATLNVRQRGAGTLSPAIHEHPSRLSRRDRPHSEMCSGSALHAVLTAYR